MTDYLYNGGEVMNGVKYKIPMLSANSILAFAKSKGNDIYSFNLNKIETKSVLENRKRTTRPMRGLGSIRPKRKR